MSSLSLAILENQIFPKIKIVHIILGGGVKKIMDFFHNLWHFMFGLLPLETNASYIVIEINCS